MQKNGYSRQLIAQYVHSGWLESPISRIYRRPKAHTDNFVRLGRSGIFDSKFYLVLPFTVGGRTALELQGYGHYLAPTGPKEIHLYGDAKPPKWLTSLPLKQNLVFHSAHLLRDCEGFSRSFW